MKNIFNKKVIRNAIYTLLCVCFFSCELVSDSFVKARSNIDSIQVVTVQKDTVWIFSGNNGHTSLVPKDYLKEK